MHPRRAIRRYVAEGLSTRSETRLRRHLALCGDCRRHYESELLLLRALAGDVSAPTSSETRALQRRAAAVATPASSAGSPGSWWEPILFVSDGAWIGAACAVALLAIVWGGARVVGGGGVAVLAEATRVTIGGEVASKGQALEAGQHLLVARDGVAELQLRAGGSVRIYPGAGLTFRTGERLLLERGKVWCVVDAREALFEVHTEDAVARVLGTSFVVARDQSVTEVRVVKGAVEVEGAAGEGRLVVQQGQKTRVAHGRGPSPPTAYSPESDEYEWLAALKKLLRRLGKGIQRGIQSLKEVFE